METFISLQDVANIVTFVAPGYFAIKTYSIIYAKPEKDFSQLVLQSVICSLPLVAVYNFLMDTERSSATSAAYVMGLVGLAIVTGFVCAQLRRLAAFQRATAAFQLPAPDEDFIKFQFDKLEQHEPVTVKLKNGEVFSGTPQGGSTYRRGEPRHYSFNNVAWFDKDKNAWDEREGSLIIDLSEIDYMETYSPLPED